jgi:hypothetical protein
MDGRAVVGWGDIEEALVHSVKCEQLQVPRTAL